MMHDQTLASDRKQADSGARALVIYHSLLGILLYKYLISE